MCFQNLRFSMDNSYYLCPPENKWDKRKNKDWHWHCAQGTRHLVQKSHATNFWELHWGRVSWKRSTCSPLCTPHPSHSDVSATDTGHGAFRSGFGECHEVATAPWLKKSRSSRMSFACLGNRAGKHWLKCQARSKLPYSPETAFYTATHRRAAIVFHTCWYGKSGELNASEAVDITWNQSAEHHVAVQNTYHFFLDQSPDKFEKKLRYT